MDMVEMKTARLSGPALDWATANAIGFKCFYLDKDRNILGCRTDDSYICVIGGTDKLSDHEIFQSKFYSPSTNWAQGGPLWGKYATRMGFCNGWLVAVEGGDAHGSTQLEALCRAIVTAWLGDTVMIPVELA